MTTYHSRSAERLENPGALTYPEPSGPPRPVEGDLYFYCVSGLRNTEYLQDTMVRVILFPWPSRLYPVTEYKYLCYFFYHS